MEMEESTTLDAEQEVGQETVAESEESVVDGEVDDKPAIADEEAACRAACEEAIANLREDDINWG